jgi:hypothetical protein
MTASLPLGLTGLSGPFPAKEAAGSQTSLLDPINSPRRENSSFRMFAVPSEILSNKPNKHLAASVGPRHNEDGPFEKDGAMATVALSMHRT